LKQGLAEPQLVRPLPATSARFGLVDGAFEQGPLLPGLGCNSDEVIDRMQLTHDRPNAIPQKARVVIRGIDARRDVPLTEEGLDLVASHIEQGTNESVVSEGMYAPKTGDPAAGEQPDENRFGLIVFLMGGGNETGSCFFAEPCVTHFACGCFDAAVANQIGIERAVGDFQRDRESPAKLANEGLVVIRFRATKMMIDVNRGELESFVAEIGES
jgi:hypothetical protein